MDVILLPSNRPADRFYRGGPKITAFRGEPSGTNREPEDWVGSTTSLFGDSSLGITVLPDGTALPAAIQAQPAAWLGDTHRARYGVDTRLLVKLLDAGQRLPVHAHPHTSFAAGHLGRSHGKAEAWYIIDGGEVHLGLTRNVDLDELQSLVDGQEVEALLGLLHRVEVHRGDIVYVPPGVLHAIGAGVFLVEVQEPEDMSILLEWRGFELDGSRDGHLGVGFDLALQALERTARTVDQIRELTKPAGFGRSVLPDAADQYFRLQHVALDGEMTLESGFAVMVTLNGEATYVNGESVVLQAGSTALVPHSAGPLTLRGRCELLVCRPPRPE